MLINKGFSPFNILGIINFKIIKKVNIKTNKALKPLKRPMAMTMAANKNANR